MFSIEKCPVPANTTLEKYATEGVYIDCYRTDVSGRVSFREYISAFYTTPLFRLERFILRLAVSKPSTDIQARQLAEGDIQRFAAWRVEDRNENELLLCDFIGRTRSWLMADPVSTIGDIRTKLYFGSAIVPKQNPKTGALSLGSGYQALIGFHQIYSLLLLYAAKLRIQHRIRSSYEKQDQFH